jgi:hypothetical protein
LWSSGGVASRVLNHGTIKKVADTLTSRILYLGGKRFHWIRGYVGHEYTFDVKANGKIRAPAYRIRFSQK